MLGSLLKSPRSGQQLVELYPTYAYPVLDGTMWRVQVGGMVYGAGDLGLRKRMWLKLLRRAMQAEPQELDSPLFHERIRGFVVEPERGQSVAVRFGSGLHPLPKPTKRNGHFRGTFRVSDDEIGRLGAAGAVRDGWVDFSAFTHAGAVDGGTVLLLKNGGLSVISDIDDTMKHTEVGCRRALLRNTFLREFRAVDGMAPLYRQWAVAGAKFHYVSSSPWQLFGPLAEYCREEEFPWGTFHLRCFRLGEHMMRKLLRRPIKRSAIHELYRHFPQRRFVLIGDSGERDPEIYGAIARNFPQQTVALFVRDLPERPMSDSRCRKAFRGLPENVWRLFRDPRELPSDLSLLRRPR